VAKAMSNNNLVRIYTGTYSGNSLELSAQQDTTASGQNAKMVVRLLKQKKMKWKDSVKLSGRKAVALCMPWHYKSKI